MAKIAFRRLKRFIGNKQIFRANETELSVTMLINGVTIYFKSADNPDLLYGEDVIAAVLDESTRMKEDSWTAVFTTLSATSGKCKIIGNVNGINNWSYRLAREAEKGKQNWSYHKLTAVDAMEAGILSKEVVDEAERTLPKGIFLELYYGIPFANSSNKFFYSFNEDKHVGKCYINYQYPIYLSFDFNYNPICAGIFQFIDGVIYCPEIIKLENSNIYTLCQVIKTKVQGGMVLVTGDATGTANSAMVKDNMNYYRIIRSELGLGSSQIKVPSANPKFEENQVLCNAVLEHMAVQIDPDKAQPLIFDLKFVQIDNNGKIIKTDRSDPTQQADASDLFRYYLNVWHRGILKQNHLNNDYNS